MTRVSLSRPLVLEGLQITPDGSGGYGEHWQALGTLWAEVVAGSGGQASVEEFTRASVPYRITVRAAPMGSPQRPGPGQRFRDGSRLFQILAVTERDAAGRLLLCFAREEEEAA
jgi:head-tail adaptor